MAAKKSKKGKKKKTAIGGYPTWLLEKHARKMGEALKRHGSDYYVGKD